MAQSVACASLCFGQEKISIPELLEFKTRTQTLQQYVLRTDQMAEIRGWNDLAAFAKAHRNITVLPSVDRREAKRLYAVTWDRFPRLTLLPSPAPAPTSLPDFKELTISNGKSQPLRSAALELAVFDEDGNSVSIEGASSVPVDGLVTDLNADGVIEVMEVKEYESVRYVTVRQLTNALPLFAVAIEWGNPAKKTEPWGFAARQRETGDFELLFGPKHGETITPEKVFQWNARHGTWECEDPGDHLWVLRLKNVWKDIVQLAEEKLEKPPRAKDPFQFTPLPPLDSGLPGKSELK